MSETLHPEQIVMSPKLRDTLNALRHLPSLERRAILRKQSFNRFMYKYRPLDREEHKDWLRDYLIDSRLRLSSPSAFNDPFDMTCNIVFQGSPQEKRKRILKLLEKASQMSEPQKNAKASELMADQKSLIETVRKSYQRQIAEAGVFSITEDPRNILMWSHYSSSHQGVCLQFEIASDVRVFTMASRVQYSDSYPIINWAKHFNSQMANNELENALTCKHQGWSYEKEHRIIVPDGAGKYLSFSPRALAGIVVGCEIKEDVKSHVIALLEERRAKGLPGIKVYQAIKHSERFELRLLETR